MSFGREKFTVREFLEFEEDQSQPESTIGNSQSNTGPIIFPRPPSLRRQHVVNGADTIDEYTRSSLIHHSQYGDWINPSTLKFGDVVFLCTYHEFYGEALRRYQFWKMVQYENKTRPLFLTQMTYNGNGPEATRHEWYLEGLSKLLKQPEPSRYKDKVFVSPAHAVVLKLPFHGYLYCKRDEKCPKEDMVALEGWLSHINTYHHELLQLICRRLTQANKEKSDNDLQQYLQTQSISPSCRGPSCKMNSHLLERYLSWKPKFRYNFDRRSDASHIKKSEKIRPPRATSAALTGMALHFVPT